MDSDVAALQADLVRIVARVRNADYMTAACQFVQGQARMLAPGDTGQLQNSILYDVERKGHLFWARVEGKVYTDLSYAPYVELGTGPKGAENHAGISPAVTPSYTLEPWWVHESMIPPGTGEKYHWPAYETDDGTFYLVSGQPAQPFLYPAMADNEDKILAILKKGIVKAMEG